MKPSTLLLPNKITHLTASRPFSQGPFFAPWVDETVSAALNVRELIRPLGQRLLFSAGNVATLSAFALALTLIRDQTVVGPHLQDRYHLSVSTYTLVNLPYVAQRPA